MTFQWHENPENEKVNLIEIKIKRINLKRINQLFNSLDQARS